MAIHDPSQPDPLSSPARRILQEIEREADLRRRSIAARQPGPRSPEMAPTYARTGAFDALDPRAGDGPHEGSAASRFLALLDAVVVGTESAHRQIDELSTTLDLALQQIQATPTAAPVSTEPAGGRTPPAAAKPQPAPGPPDRQPHHPLDPRAASTPDPATKPSVAATDGARLVAIEMAVGGSTRHQVGQRLQAEYGVAAPEPILDDVFGPGTDGTSRIPWGQA